MKSDDLLQLKSLQRKVHELIKFGEGEYRKMNDEYVRTPTPAMNKNKGSDDNYLVAKKRIRG